MTQATTAPAPAGQTSAPPTTANTPTPVAADPGATVVDAYQSARLSREVIRNRLEGLDDRREEIVQQLRDGTVSDADKAGLNQRLVLVDQQIAATTIDLAEAETRVATTAAVPGAAREPAQPNDWENGPPEDVVMMGIFFSALLLMPIVIAWARRIWRRSAKTEVTLPPQLVDRMASLEQSIDAVAIEVERIGEGQRFVSQLLADRAKAAALPEGRAGGAASGR